MRRSKIYILFTLIFILFFISLLIYLRKAQKEEKKKIEVKIQKIIEELTLKDYSLDNFRFLSFSSFLDKKFFEEAKKKLQKEELDFILVELNEKKLYFYKKGKLKNTFSILAQGKEGSFWETPAGFYQVEAKIKNVFSTIGQVWMPYSLQFQGNFFIHGWPYYANGKAVESTFSGGCIRLATNDAKILFYEVDIKTPVLVIKETFFSDDFSPEIKVPEISASAFLVADLKSNFVFLSKNIEDSFPIASITKLMTALVATEYINLWREITIQSTDLVFTSYPRLKIGEKWTGFDLLYPLLNESSNESAKAMARFLGEEHFVELMNKKALSLGLENTYFADTSGASPENISSPADLFFFAKYLYFNRRFLLEISRAKIHFHLISRNLSDLKNFNCFKETKNFMGGKVGKTKEAGETILAIFEASFKKEKRPIAIILLNSKEVCGETQKILDWLQTTFE